TDTLQGGGGADTFIYEKYDDSNYKKTDHIVDFTAGTDKLQFDFAVTDVDGPVSGSVASGSFAADIETLCSGVLEASHAIQITATSGTLAGHIYLVVDANDLDGFQKGVDYVMDVTGISGTVTGADFVIG